MILEQDRKFQVSTFTYDPLDRRILSEYDDGSTTSFTYDTAGRLTIAEDSTSGRIEFSYDNLDRLVQELTPQGTVAYQYDPIGRRTNMTVNGQTPVTYQYDSASRLTQVAQGAQVVGLGYDAAGRRTSLSYPNGVNTTYTYDFASRLTNILHEGPSSIIEDLTYTYDAAGNRISFTRTNGTATLLPDAVQAAYDAANEQIQFDSATANLTYDANGNLTSQTDASGTTNYTWDARNMLIGINGPGISANFTYDAFGRRISKTFNGVITKYQYDGIDTVGEIGVSSVSATYLRSLNIDEPLVRQSGTNEYYHRDALGSVLALTDQAGFVQTIFHYNPFGNTNVTGSTSNPIRFSSREDDQTGLYYLRARYYSPTLKRFVSEDPIGLAGLQINLYAYVWNNPLTFIDPEGLTGIGGFLRPWTSISRVFPRFGPPPPPVTQPKPPGWNPSWQWRYPEGTSAKTSPRWFDPKGGEWRWHSPDKYHPRGHWDHNPWTQWNSPWRTIEAPSFTPPVTTVPEQSGECGRKCLLPPPPMDWEECFAKGICA